MIELVLMVALAATMSLSNSALSEIKQKQIDGLAELLTDLDGVYATCQLVLFREEVDFKTAENNCKKFELGGNVEGQLATVNDDVKNTDLKLLLAMAYPKSSGLWASDEWVWAGLRKVKNNKGDKKGLVYNPADWEWADGSTPKDYKNWIKDQPDQRAIAKDGIKYLQNQMRINHNGGWDDTFAYKTHPYACDYQGKYILSATRKSWSDAKQACEDAALIMAKVRNPEEVEEMKSAGEYFLGPVDPSLRVFDAANWIWLGGNDAEEEGVWEWNDGQSFGGWFKNMPWRKRQPDNGNFLSGAGTQNYLAISKKGFFDDSFDSPERKRPFACQCPDT